jgi:DNA-binding CsgD family transcriptional regulator
MFGVIERKGTTVVCLVLSRKADKPPFTDEEAARLGVMLRAVGSAWRMERSARARVAHTGAAWNVLNRLTLGIILLDHKGQIAAVNLKALEVLRRGDTLTAFNGSLSLSLPQENLQLQAILGEFLASLPQQPPESSKALAVSRPDGKASIHLILTRVTNGTAAHGNRQNLIAVFLSDPEQLGTPREEWLQDLYGLTRVESRLAVLMCQGLTPDEIAKKLRISVHTVRAYLKDVFLKMGVNRQAAMVRRLVDGPGQLRTDSAVDQRMATTIGSASKTTTDATVRVN